MLRWSFLRTALALVCLTHPAHSDEDSEPIRESLFVCGVGPIEENYMAITGVNDENAHIHTDLQFHAEIPGEAPITFPEHPEPGEGNFFFSNTDGPDGYLVSIRFSQGATKYRLYSLNVPPDDPSELPGGGAGLVITQADGTSQKISCSEGPYEFIVYMRRAMTCDVDPRYDASFCDPYDPPVRVKSDPLP